VQLREIGIASNRIRNAILDYYRAFEQRSAWARENLLVSGELEEYEDRMVDEWSRYRDVVFEDLDEKSAEAVLLAICTSRRLPYSCKRPPVAAGVLASPLPDPNRRIVGCD